MKKIAQALQERFPKAEIAERYPEDYRILNLFPGEGGNTNELPVIVVYWEDHRVKIFFLPDKKRIFIKYYLVPEEILDTRSLNPCLWPKKRDSECSAPDPEVVCDRVEKYISDDKLPQKRKKMERRVWKEIRKEQKKDHHLPKALLEILQKSKKRKKGA